MGSKPQVAPHQAMHMPRTRKLLFDGMAYSLIAYQLWASLFIQTTNSLEKCWRTSWRQCTSWPWNKWDMFRTSAMRRQRLIW